MSLLLALLATGGVLYSDNVSEAAIAASDACSAEVVLSSSVADTVSTSTGSSTTQNYWVSVVEQSASYVVNGQQVYSDGQPLYLNGENIWLTSGVSIQSSESSTWVANDTTADSTATTENESAGSLFVGANSESSSSTTQENAAVNYVSLIQENTTAAGNENSLQIGNGIISETTSSQDTNNSSQGFSTSITESGISSITQELVIASWSGLRAETNAIADLSSAGVSSTFSYSDSSGSSTVETTLQGFAVVINEAQVSASAESTTLITSSSTLDANTVLDSVTGFDAVVSSQVETNGVADNMSPQINYVGSEAESLGVAETESAVINIVAINVESQVATEQNNATQSQVVSILESASSSDSNAGLQIQNTSTSDNSGVNDVTSSGNNSSTSLPESSTAVSEIQTGNVGFIGIDNASITTSDNQITGLSTSISRNEDIGVAALENSSLITLASAVDSINSTEAISPIYTGFVALAENTPAGDAVILTANMSVTYTDSIVGSTSEFGVTINVATVSESNSVSDSQSGNTITTTSQLETPVSTAGSTSGGNITQAVDSSTLAAAESLNAGVIKTDSIVDSTTTSDQATILTSIIVGTITESSSITDQQVVSVFVVQNDIISISETISDTAVEIATLNESASSNSNEQAVTIQLSLVQDSSGSLSTETSGNITTAAINETISNSDSSQITIGSNFADSVISSNAQFGAVIFVVSMTENNSVSATENAGTGLPILSTDATIPTATDSASQIFAVTQNETISANSIETVGASIWVGQQNETLDSTTSESRTLVIPTAVSESFVCSDAISTGLTFGRNVADSAAINESSSTISSTYGASVSDITLTSDSSSATDSLPVSNSDNNAASDIESALINYVGLDSNTISISSIENGGVITSTSISDLVTSTTVQNANSVIVVSIFESTICAESCSSTKTTNDSVNENISAAEFDVSGISTIVSNSDSTSAGSNQSTTNSTFNAVVSDTIFAFDQVSENRAVSAVIIETTAVVSAEAAGNEVAQTTSEYIGVNDDISIGMLLNTADNILGIDAQTAQREINRTLVESSNITSLTTNLVVARENISEANLILDNLLGVTRTWTSEAVITNDIAQFDFIARSNLNDESRCGDMQNASITITRLPTNEWRLDSTMFYKNVPTTINVLMKSDLDHMTALDGLELNISLSKNGGSFTHVNRDITPLGNGVYSIQLLSSDISESGELLILATGVGADNSLVVGTVLNTPSALSLEQSKMLLEIYNLMGLDPTKPLVVTETTRTAGSEINQTIDEQGGIVTVTRT